ncbi:MAG: carbohydrate kinase [Lachnospiraceae bacterium]|nr:carbohydrate kinase [Lachnospiraceae bacterium]
MKKLLTIGEALIDFIPSENGKHIYDVESFTPKVGGAPANVGAVYALLGGDSYMITQLGNDPFGQKIINRLNSVNVKCDYIKRTDKANTSLAFVALSEDGNREFSFYRKPGADMIMEPSQVKEEWFEDSFALHFCSVSLGDFPMKDAHKKAIEYAKNHNAIVSFDPNLRFNLWDDVSKLKAAVHEFIPLCNILKISDEELEFITGREIKSDEDAKAAVDTLFIGDVKMIIYTKGGDGSEVFTKNAHAAVTAEKVKPLDTTGAGDAFIGSFLFQLGRDELEVKDLNTLTEEKLTEYLHFATRYCGVSICKYGAIASYPSKEEFLK